MHGIARMLLSRPYLGRLIRLLAWTKPTSPERRPVASLPTGSARTVGLPLWRLMMNSLDNTLVPDRLSTSELVPSRYVVQVGEIDVLVVSDGVLPLPTAMLAHNADPAVRTAWMENMFLSPEAFDWALNVVVVRSGEQTILIDAGLGSDPDLQLPRAGQAVKRLQAAGIDLSSVTDVIITHMHMDHIGGLLVEGVKDQLRPDLRIHVAAAEIEFW